MPGGARRPAQLWSRVERTARDSHATHDSVTLSLVAIDGSALEREPEASMSERNGDRARFQKNRKRRLRHRQRIQEFVKSLRAQPPTPTGQEDKGAARG